MRNMVQSGIPDRVRWLCRGTKREAIFDRYNIVSETDLEQAVQRLQWHSAVQSNQRKITPITDRPKPAAKGRTLC